MNRTRILARACALSAALALLPISGAVFAHGPSTQQAEEFYEHMDLYATNINELIASVDAIVASYEPGQDYSKQMDALIEQWETVEFHEAVEDNATPLYPPVWAALGALSSALDEGAPVATVEAKADAITAALWQGYGALKLLTIQREQGDDHSHHGEHETKQMSGEAVIDTINDNLDQVLVLYKDDQIEAAQKLIYNTYMNYFEGIEGDLIEQDAKLVSSLEVDFNATLPGLIKKGAPADEVAAQIDAMHKDLNKAGELLEKAEQDETSVF